jgi:hypothetical protein
MVASEPPHRLRGEPRKRRPTGVAKRGASLPEGADMAESPAGPRGFAERRHEKRRNGRWTPRRRDRGLQRRLCRSSRKTPVRFSMTTLRGPGTGYAATGTPRPWGRP